MHILVGKSHDFRFNARTIARTYALNLSVVERRIGQAFAQHFVHFRAGIYNPARALLERTRHRRQIGKLMEIVLPILAGSKFKLDGTAVNTHRRAGFHTVGSKAELFQLFSNTVGSRFGNTSSGKLYASDMHQSVQERTGSKHNRLSLECHAKRSLYACHLAVLNHQFRCRILPHIQACLI